MAHGVPLRRIAALLAGVFVVLGAAGLVAAKFPYFSVELQPAEPQPGEPITVTVRTWADADHSQPDGLTYEGTLTDLIEFQRTGAGGGPALVPVELQMLEPGVFHAQVSLPAGEWQLVAFPHGRGAGSDFGPGYPEPMSIVLREEATWSLWLASGLATAFAAAAAAVFIRSRRMRVPHEGVASRSTSVP